MERSWLKEIEEIQEKAFFFLFISASWVFMLASVSDFYLQFTFKKSNPLHYLLHYFSITCQHSLC